MNDVLIPHARMNHCLIGDCRDSIRSLIEQGVKVQMCVTSPPYWGLRDYGTAQWEGGDNECDHDSARIAVGNSPSNKSTLTTNNGAGPKPGDKFASGSQFGYAKQCECGANRVDKQLGLESTPQEYVANMVEVFRLVRDLLSDDGVLWLNLGDSYAANRSYQVIDNKHTNVGNDMAMRVPDGLKPKDLVGIPWRVAFALQADGWYLRQDIIWAKPNPMPESVTDRCTKSHEYLFLLAKSERYYYDAAGIAEPFADERMGNPGKYEPRYQIGAARNDGNQIGANGEWNGSDRAGRNKRSVWTVATQPYSEAHFATFPPKLIEPCILAGSRPDDTVLDPFFGSGTTGEVCERLGRQWIGCELSEDYGKLADQRTAQMGMTL